MPNKHIHKRAHSSHTQSPFGPSPLTPVIHQEVLHLLPHPGLAAPVGGGGWDGGGRMGALT
jgi:hypothetical protein